VGKLFPNEHVAWALDIGDIAIIFGFYCHIEWQASGERLWQVYLKIGWIRFPFLTPGFECV
jgi:hypothetical protein